MSVPYKRRGSWVGGIDVAGKRHWVGSFRTKAEWEDAAAELRYRLQLDQPLDERLTTIGQFVGKGWPHTHPKPTRTKPTSVERLEISIRPLVRDFGDRPLRGGIKRSEARAWALAASQSHVSAARSMFNDAIDDDLASANPFAALGLETSPGRRNIEVISNEEFEELVVVARTTREDVYGEILSALVLWQGTVGTRPGEAWALRFDDLQPEVFRARISRRTDRYGRLDVPKSGLAREVIVPPRVMETVLNMPRLSDELLFPNPSGGMMKTPAWARFWHPIRSAFTQTLPEAHWLRERIRREAKVDKPNNGQLTLYEMRHRAATFMSEFPPLGLGLDPAAVAAQLGHTDGGKLVTQLYRHMSTRRALDRVQDAFEAEGDTPEKTSGEQKEEPDVGS